MRTSLLTDSLTLSLTQFSLQTLFPKIHQLNYPVQTRSHFGHYQGCWWADWFRGVQGWFRISTTFSMLIAILLLSGDPVWGGGNVQPALHCQHGQSGADSCNALLSFLLFSQNPHHNMDWNFFDNSLNSFYFKDFYSSTTKSVLIMAF